jgi:thioredoxin reductase
MHGFLSRDGMPPLELLAAGRAELARYGVEVVNDTVVGLDHGFRVRLASRRRMAARRVLVATGLHDVLPDVPGVTERWGRDLLHCPYCHGYEVRDQPLGVLGGTPEVVAHALLVRQWTPDVTLFPHTDRITAAQREQLAARDVRVVEGTVARLVVEDDELHGLELADGTVEHRRAVFVRPGFVPASGLLTALGCTVDDEGWVVVDKSGRTSVNGLWAAGNVVDPHAPVVTAAGAGSAAGVAVNADLVAEDVQHAVADRRGHHD